ncbi:conserved hypothetical protein [Ricinus communis]|uniref:DUF674 domain-containing protein n=1 Tax=Ricinus communis TaxID=3988 RepID=B9T151_RICCO|nr:conserved hypothetical protein [Ricinus communis]
MATTSNSKVRLKLLIDKKGQKVLFAEANKDFVDFLFSLMSLPLGNMIRLLTKNKMVGCLGNLYDSVEALSDAYFRATDIKESILKPNSHMQPNVETPLLLPSSELPDQKLYCCSKHPSHCYTHQVTDDPNTDCPSCSHKMSQSVSFVTSTDAKFTSNDAGDL